MVRAEQIGQQGDVILQAACRGQRIIMNQLGKEPHVMNMRKEELEASPNKHHLITLQG